MAAEPQLRQPSLFASALVALPVLAVGGGLQSVAVVGRYRNETTWIAAATLILVGAAYLAGLACRASSKALPRATRLVEFVSFVVVLAGGAGAIRAITLDHWVVWATSMALIASSLGLGLVHQRLLLRMVESETESTGYQALAGRDPEDPRKQFPGVRHWGRPTEDLEPYRLLFDHPAEKVLREVHEFEAIAFARAAWHRQRARRWQIAQYAVGLPAAMFAGLAGAAGISGLTAHIFRVVGPESESPQDFVRRLNTHLDSIGGLGGGNVSGAPVAPT
jgi:hypothetical protein